MSQDSHERMACQFLATDMLIQHADALKLKGTASSSAPALQRLLQLNNGVVL